MSIYDDCGISMEITRHYEEVLAVLTASGESRDILSLCPFHRESRYDFL